MNLIDACIDQGVKKVVALSTDKASSPINLYASKLLQISYLFQATVHIQINKKQLSVVRYGNVMGSRGSIIPFFISIKNKGILPITDNER